MDRHPSSPPSLASTRRSFRSEPSVVFHLLAVAVGPREDTIVLGTIVDLVLSDCSLIKKESIQSHGNRTDRFFGRNTSGDLFTFDPSQCPR